MKIRAQLIKSLLDSEAYKTYGEGVRQRHLTGAEKKSIYWDLFKTLRDYYKNNEQSIPLDTLKALHMETVDDSRQAVLDEYEDMFTDIKEAEVNEGVMHYLRQCKVASIASKSGDDIHELKLTPNADRLQKVAEGILTELGTVSEEEKLELESPEEALEQFEAMSEFDWSDPHFNELAGGFGRGRHALFYALSGMGKSSFTLDKVAHFLRQDLKILDISIAEDTKTRRIPHLIQTMKGFTREELASDYRAHYAEFYENNKSNYYFKELPAGARVSTLKPLIKTFQPDVVIVDGFMKLTRAGSETNRPAELANIIADLKSMCTEHNFALIACCQAAQTATGKKFLTSADIAQSKVDVPGEFEIAVGIGCDSANPDMSSNRYISFAKQKIGKAGKLAYEFISANNKWSCRG